MKFLWLIGTVLVTLLTSAEELKGSQHDVEIQRGLIGTVYKVLAAECPSHSNVKRDELVSTDLEIHRAYYQQLVKQLIECRRNTSE